MNLWSGTQDYTLLRLFALDLVVLLLWTPSYESQIAACCYLHDLYKYIQINTVNIQVIQTCVKKSTWHFKNNKKKKSRNKYLRTKLWENLGFFFSSLVLFSAFSPDLCGFKTLSYFMEIFSPLTPALQPRVFFCFAEPAWAAGGRCFLQQSRGHCNFSGDSAQSEPHRVGLAMTSHIVTAPYSHISFELCSLW